MLYFYTPQKHLKISGFLMLSRGIEVEDWLKMRDATYRLEAC